MPNYGGKLSRDHNVSVGCGGAAFGTGVLGLIALAAWAASTTPTLFTQRWFDLAFALLTFLGLAGLYAVVNPWTHWWMPPVRDEPWRPWRVLRYPWSLVRYLARVRLELAVTTRSEGRAKDTIPAVDDTASTIVAHRAEERNELYARLLEPFAGDLDPGGPPHAAIFDYVVKMVMNGQLHLDATEVRAVVENMYWAAAPRDPPTDWFEVEAWTGDQRGGWHVHLQARAFGELVRRDEAEARKLQDWLRRLMRDIRDLPQVREFYPLGAPIQRLGKSAAHGNRSDDRLQAELAAQRDTLRDHMNDLATILSPRSTTTLLHGTASPHTGPPVPIPAYDVVVKLQSPDVFLAVVNGATIRTFRGQVVEVRGARDEPATPWAIAWRDDGSRNTKILTPGETQLLWLGTGDGMGNAAEQPRPEEVHYAVFHLRRVNGSALTVEPAKASLADFARQDHLFQVRVRIYCDDVGSDFVVRLGFVNEKDATGNIKVNATIGDWDAR